MDLVFGRLEGGRLAGVVIVRPAPCPVRLFVAHLRCPDAAVGHQAACPSSAPPTRASRAAGRPAPRGRARMPRLVLVSAPAGFGKTTLLTQWLASRPAEGRDQGRGLHARRV